MPLIWTDETNHVTRIHYNPELLSEHQTHGAIGVGSIPDPDPTVDGEPVLFYTDADGFYYEYE